MKFLGRKQFLFKTTIFFIAFILSFSLIESAKAASYCFCGSDLTKINVKDVASGKVDLTDSSQYSRDCKEWSNACGVLEPEMIKLNPTSKYLICEDTQYSSKEKCLERQTKWQNDLKTLISQGQYEAGAKTTAGKFIPSCVVGDLTGETPSSTCRDVSIFITMAINVAKYLFSIVGAIALLMLIYGGLTLILSQGSPEKTKKGYDILVAAIIGLVIVFSAYVLVKYFGDYIVGVKTQYKLK